MIIYYSLSTQVNLMFIYYSLSTQVNLPHQDAAHSPCIDKQTNNLKNYIYNHTYIFLLPSYLPLTVVSSLQPNLLILFHISTLHIHPDVFLRYSCLGKNIHYLFLSCYPLHLFYFSRFDGFPYGCNLYL